jgi:hypothetical protein
LCPCPAVEANSLQGTRLGPVSSRAMRDFPESNSISSPNLVQDKGSRIRSERDSPPHRRPQTKQLAGACRFFAQARTFALCPAPTRCVRLTSFILSTEARQVVSKRELASCLLLVLAARGVHGSKDDFGTGDEGVCRILQRGVWACRLAGVTSNRAILIRHHTSSPSPCSSS